MLKPKLKTCAFCKKERIIFKNTVEGPLCWYCYRAGKGKKKKIMTHGAALIQEADAKFSYIVRHMHRIQASGSGVKVKCYTCDKVLNFSDAQCGHYMSRSLYNTRWMVENCRPQCKHCNENLNGNIQEFARRLELECPGITEQLSQLSKIAWVYSVDEMEKMIIKLKEELLIWIKTV